MGVEVVRIGADGALEALRGRFGVVLEEGLPSSVNALA